MTRSPSAERPGDRRVRAARGAGQVGQAGRDRWWERAVRGVRVLGGAGVAALVVALVVGVVPMPTPVIGVSSNPLAAPAACAAPATDGSISVAVAVDPGGVSGMVGGPETMCVTVPAGASGADVLVARARALGRPVPRYNSAGLLCAIDGQPATGCGERVDGAYRYWAYFLGTGGWTYAGTGPALRRANVATAEGWRFVAGAGNASDPPPRATASSAAICPPPPPPAPPTTAAPVAASPTPSNPDSVPGPGGGGSMGGPGSRGSATFGEAGTQPGGGGSGGGSSASGGSDVSPSGGGSGGDGAAVGDGGSAGASATGESRSGDEVGRRDDELAGAPVVDTSSSGGPPAGALVAAALVVAFAAGAVVQVRRRSAS